MVQLQIVGPCPNCGRSLTLSVPSPAADDYMILNGSAVAGDSRCPGCLSFVVAWPKEAKVAPGSPSRFVNVKLNVMQGAQCVARACSKTFAKRIARALNNHKTNSEGV
jgi:hypothetical protein